MQLEILNEKETSHLEALQFEEANLQPQASNIGGNKQLETMIEAEAWNLVFSNGGGAKLQLEASNEGGSLQLETSSDNKNLQSETSSDNENLQSEASSDNENLQSEASSDNENFNLQSEASSDIEKVQASSDNENLESETSSDDEIQPCMLETASCQNWFYGTGKKTMCGFIWSRNSDPAADDEMSRGVKPVGIQLTSSFASGRGLYCSFLVDPKLRSSAVTWEVMTKQ